MLKLRSGWNGIILKETSCGVLDDLVKNAALLGAVEASKDKNGEPESYKAAGIAVGMGNFSFSDMARLGAMLGSQGAFDIVFRSGIFVSYRG